MSGDTEIDDPEVSDGASENEYSDHDQDIGKEEDDNTDMAEQKFRSESDENGNAVGSTVTAKPKLDPKDPLRPRRKKARRACFACQRAHLTCGDERPCQRCIKRGLAEGCQDGVRKKAKYLHDAPPEALRPVLGPNYNPSNNTRPINGPSTTVTSTVDTSPIMGGGTFFPQPNTSPSYPIFPTNQQNQMAPPLQGRRSYSSQQSPISPSFTNPANIQPSMQGLAMPQTQNNVQNAFTGPIFDPSNPALFNFDLEGLNFGNHYGALEFGMLGHMSSGAAQTPPNDNPGSMSSQNMGDVSFNGSVFNTNMSPYGQMYSQDMLPEFVGVDRQNSSGHIFANTIHHGMPHAYAIATGTTSGHSPSTDNSPAASGMGFDSSPNFTPSATPHSQSSAHRPPKRQDTKPTPPKFGPVSVLGKRTRDPSSIYDTVQEPYSYTTGFHSLTAFLQRRFSPTKTLRIAKSMASIRPSFISCTKALTRQDLIFMEKCFQRMLFDYEEEYMQNCCTPTLVCRRTGEIAAVNKEFTLLTGWRKDVLLGKEPNLNINNGNPEGSVGSGSGGNTGRAGLATPRMRTLSMATAPGIDSKPQPVFVAELLDDDSVIEFYEDFAKLAFGDSRGSVTTKCKLLKYQPKDGIDTLPEVKDEGKSKRKEMSGGIGGMGNRIGEIGGEHGIGRLEKDGKMDCAYCWTVKRDVFDIPMLIVMNFLPCI